MITQVNKLVELQDIIDQNDNVLVCFSALAWCVPCKRFAPHYQAASDTRDDVVFVEVDADTVLDVVSAYGVASVPTVLFVKGDEVEHVSARTVLQLNSYLDTKITS